MSARRLNPYLIFLLFAFLVAWVLASIDPVYPEDWLLENYLVFIFVPIIIVGGLYFRLSNISYTLITIFMILHVAGSHYTYAEVPFGYTLQEWFGAERNLYDRLVHCCFGLLIAYPMMEVFMRLSQAKGFWAYYFPFELTLAFSAIYEVIEWGAAAFVDPEAGLAFLGAQGDVWDAQKDMLMAGLGALITMKITFLITLVVNGDAWQEFKESFRVPEDDRPIGEIQLIEWYRERWGRKSK